MAELDRHGATVLVRSSTPPGAELADPQLPALLMDLTVDALDAAGFLPGVLRRHGAIRSILAYAGGAIPDLAWYLERAGSCLPTMPENTPQGAAAR